MWAKGRVYQGLGLIVILLLIRRSLLEVPLQLSTGAAVALRITIPSGFPQVTRCRNLSGTCQRCALKCLRLLFFLAGEASTLSDFTHSASLG